MKIFHFSCKLVIDFTVSWLLKYVLLLLMVKMMLKVIKKNCVFSNKGDSIELLFEMNTNTLFDNQFYLNYIFLQTRNVLRYLLICNVKLFHTFQIFRINLNRVTLAANIA